MKIVSCLAVTALTAVSAFAATNQVLVPGTADVWLAGQANGTILQGIYALFDQAPTNSPLLASAGLNMTAGSYLTFSVTGSTNYNGCASSTPDGNPCGTFTTVPAGPYFGISTYAGPINAVVGVFVGPNTPGGTAPSGLDFTSAGAQSQATISPGLNQVFFIGDGLTGTGSGSTQHFVIPAGATRLFLGSSDGAGANYNNSGSLTVTITDASGSTAPTVPAISAPALLVTGLLLVGITGYLFAGRKRHA